MAGTKQHPQPAPPPGAAVVDPKFEWAEKAGSYVLRLTLTGFKKDDFRVQVDGAGRLTVRGTMPSASLHKVFQLPSAAILDDIAGRFEASVLTLTVPKRAGAGALKQEIAPKVAPTEKVDGAMKTGDAGGEKKAPKPAPSSVVAPTSMEEIRAKPKEEGSKKMPAMDDGAEKKEDVEPKESVLSRTTRLVAEQVQRMEEEAKRRKQEQQKPKVPQATTAPVPVTREKPAPKPSLGEKSKEVLEEETAKAASAATSMEARAKQEKKATSTATTFTAWKERMTEGLGQLTDMKWADGAVEMARKNKEVLAVGIAAFSLGFFVSHRLFRK